MQLMKRYLDEEQQRRLLQAPKRVADPLAQRDFHWLRLLIQTGMRVAEFASLTVAQAESALRTGWIVVPKEARKGGCHGHEYAVTQSVRESLERLSFMARAEAADWPAVTRVPLVWGREGTPLSVRSYQARLKLWLGEAGLDARISIHWLRHTRGMNVLRRSRAAGDKQALKLAQLALGHQNISSTGVYLTLSREEFADAMAAVDTGRLSKRAARRLASAQAQGAQA